MLTTPPSNNIQDRPNLEMMTHLEGPIVDSFYETALHSWYNRLEPVLPCIAQAYQPPPGGYRFGGNNPYFAEIEVVQAAKAARKLLRRETAAHMEADDSGYEEGFMMTVRRAMERAAAVGGERWDEFVSHHTGEDNPLQVLRGRVRAGFASRPTSRRPSMDLIPKMPRKFMIMLAHLSPADVLWQNVGHPRPWDCHNMLLKRPSTRIHQQTIGKNQRSSILLNYLRQRNRLPNKRSSFHRNRSRSRSRHSQHVLDKNPLIRQLLQIQRTSHCRLTLQGDQGQGLSECKLCQKNSVGGEHGGLLVSKLTGTVQMLVLFQKLGLRLRTRTTWIRSSRISSTLPTSRSL